MLSGEVSTRSRFLLGGIDTIDTPSPSRRYFTWRTHKYGRWAAATPQTLTGKYAWFELIRGELETFSAVRIHCSRTVGAFKENSYFVFHSEVLQQL